MDFVARRQLPFALQCVGIDARAVEAVEVADPPTLIRVINFGVFPAAEIVLENDAIGPGPAHGISMADGQGKHVAKSVLPASDQVSRCSRGHIAWRLMSSETSHCD